MPTPTYLTGFEWPGVTTIVNTGGGLVAAVTGAPTVEAGSARSGSFGMRCNAAGTGKFIAPTVTATAVIVTRFWFKFAANPSGAVFLCNLTTGTDVAGIQLSTSGVIGARAGPSGSVQTGPTLATGTWHVVECRFNGLSGTSWTTDWRVNGVAQTQASGTASGANSDTSYAIGVTGNVTLDLSVDDLIISETSGDYPIGPGFVVGIAPAGAAEHQSITLAEWATTSDFSAFSDFTASNESTSAPLIDDLTAGTDGIRADAGAAGQAGNARWSFADPSPDHGTVPNGVRGIVVHQDASSGTNNITERILLSASTANIFSGNPAAAWEYRGAIFALDPAGGAWSNQDIKDLKFEIDSTDTNPNVWFGGVVLEIDYQGLNATVAVPAATFSVTGPITDAAAVTVGPAVATITVAAGVPVPTVTVVVPVVTISTEAPVPVVRVTTEVPAATFSVLAPAPVVSITTPGTTVVVPVATITTAAPITDAAAVTVAPTAAMLTAAAQPPVPAISILPGAAHVDLLAAPPVVVKASNTYQIPAATFTVQSTLSGAAVTVGPPAATFSVLAPPPGDPTISAIAVPAATFTVAGHIEDSISITVVAPAATFSVLALPNVFTGPTIAVPTATISVAAYIGDAITVTVNSDTAEVTTAAQPPLPKLTILPSASTLTVAAGTPVFNLVILPSAATTTWLAPPPVGDLVQSATILPPVAVFTVAMQQVCVNEPIVTSIDPDDLTMTALQIDSLVLTAVSPAGLSLTPVDSDGLSLTPVSPDTLTLEEVEVCD